MRLIKGVGTQEREYGGAYSPDFPGASKSGEDGVVS